MNEFHYVTGIYFTDIKLLKLVTNQISSYGDAIVFDVNKIDLDDVIKLIKLLDVKELSVVPIRKNK